MSAWIILCAYLVKNLMLREVTLLNVTLVQQGILIFIKWDISEKEDAALSNMMLREGRILTSSTYVETQFSKTRES